MLSSPARKAKYFMSFGSSSNLKTKLFESLLHTSKQAHSPLSSLPQITGTLHRFLQFKKLTS